MNNCPFCILGSMENQEVILSNATCMFLQLPQDILIGSGIIVPKAHRETVFDLTDEEWQDTFDLLQKVKGYLDDLHRPQGYNVGWNCGEVGGQHIFHAHLHVIPRFEDEPMAGRGIRYWLKSEENRRATVR